MMTHVRNLSFFFLRLGELQFFALLREGVMLEV
jgi:hypothetical protein